MGSILMSLQNVCSYMNPEMFSALLRRNARGFVVSASDLFKSLISGIYGVAYKPLWS